MAKKTKINVSDTCCSANTCSAVADLTAVNCLSMDSGLKYLGVADSGEVVVTSNSNTCTNANAALASASNCISLDNIITYVEPSINNVTGYGHIYDTVTWPSTNIYPSLTSDYVISVDATQGRLSVQPSTIIDTACDFTLVARRKRLSLKFGM